MQTFSLWMSAIAISGCVFNFFAAQAMVQYSNGQRSSHPTVMLKPIIYGYRGAGETSMVAFAPDESSLNLKPEVRPGFEVKVDENASLMKFTVDGKPVIAIGVMLSPEGKPEPIMGMLDSTGKLFYPVQFDAKPVVLNANQK